MKEGESRRELIQVLFFALTLFILVSLLSYQATDPSFLNHSFYPVKIQNACGRVGSELSTFLIKGFGLGAFAVPFGLGFLSVAGVRRKSRLDHLEMALGFAIAVLSMSVFLSLQWKSWRYGGESLDVGGAVGLWISRSLVAYLNTVGSSIFTLACFYLSLTVTSPVSPLSLLGRGAFLILEKLQKLIPLWPGKWIEKRLSFLFRMAHFWPRIRLKPKAARSEVEIEPVSPLRVMREPRPEKLKQDESGIHEPIITRKVAEKFPKVSLQARSGDWELPSIDLLASTPRIEASVNRERLVEHSQILKQKFLDFGIMGEVTAVRPGPVITLYEFKPGPGVKVSRIAALADDLSMALSAQSVRILAPLPGKAVVGIEIPSEIRECVYLKELLQHPLFHSSQFLLPIVMGKDISGQPYLADLAKMPHLLCAGQTGSGKSVFMNALICSLLFRFSPDELRMILVDPKFIEFRAFQDIPHLLLPVVDDPNQASIALRWAVQEMERRYRLLGKLGCRNLAAFNQKMDELGVDHIKELLFEEEDEEGSIESDDSSQDWMECFEGGSQGTSRIGKLPYIVIIIDELADLMMVAKKDVEISIARIAQKARAAGLHLVIATQRPSTDVVTGLIKANLPSRASFQLASYVDSKTILDRAGAERLLGQGDLLFIPPGSSQLLRLHGAYLSDSEIDEITGFLRRQGKPSYRNEILLSEQEEDKEVDSSEPLFEEAVALVHRSGQASASFLQRQLKVGYNRAARMIERMEDQGIVGPQDGARAREVFDRRP